MSISGMVSTMLELHESSVLCMHNSATAMGNAAAQGLSVSQPRIAAG